MKTLKNFCNLFICAIFAMFVFAGCVSNSNYKKGNSFLQLDSAVRTGSLDNGISYFTRKNSYPANRISLRLVVKAGSAMEDDDQKGVAHFVEHLAFNGTENFEKSAIVDFFEKIGMNFGAEVNAYTSFEETVYMIEIPADDPKLLETALLVLHDWACALTFDSEEIEKERGVITEEWRLRQNLQGRVSDKQCEILLKNSVFADRLPIGDMNIIKNVSRERIIDFYKKWYRPEFMSVIVVGDADTTILENAVKQAMSVIPKSQEKIPLPKFSIPVPAEKSLTIMKDAEQPYTNVFIFNPVENYKICETEEDIQNLLAKQIALSVFNVRLEEITNTPEAKWLTAGASQVALTNYSLNDYLFLVPKSGMFQEALKDFFDNTDKFSDFGITQTELDRIKEGVLNKAELDFQNKDKTYSSTHADNIVRYVLNGEIPISSEEYKRICSKVVPNITIEQVNEKAKTAFANRGKMMLVLSSQKEKIPSENEINSVWKDYKNSEIVAYEDDVSDSRLMDRPKNKGKVVSKSQNKNLGTKEYVLDNGIKIITKKNDFEKNMMYMNVISKGGIYKLNEEDVANADASLRYMLYSGFENLTYSQLIKKIQSKQVNLNFNIGKVSEHFTGNCKFDDNEILLQLMHLMFSQPQFTEESWQTVLQSYYATAQAYGSLPEHFYNEKINEILYGKNDIYHAPFDMNAFNKLNAKSAEKVWHERFGNPADFVFIFVGDFDENILIENCCVYLGTLKTNSAREETVYKYWDFPQGKPAATVKKGIGNKADVFMAFGGFLPLESNIEQRTKDSFLMEQLQSLLDIRLREAIREDKSGSYGIAVDAFIDGFPQRYFNVQIDFGCEPNRVQELADEVINQIKKIQTEPIDSVYIEKLQEACRRNREVNLFENYWWLDRIVNELFYDYEPQWYTKDVNKLISWITQENLKDAAKKYLNPENYVTVFLVPEK